MLIVFVFAATLLFAVLISELANRTVVSTAVLFLLAGIALSQDLFGLTSIGPQDPAVILLSSLALFSVLFTDGMHLTARVLRNHWHLPVRALLLGLPLTLLLTAVLARYVVGLSWTESVLVGAVLSPTDPVFAAAIVGRKNVPARLRRLLNVESGLNDGLSLPIVLVILATISKKELGLFSLSRELVLGLLLGILIPFVAIRLEQSRYFASTVTLRPLNAFAIGILVYSAASFLNANLFLAAFAAGLTIATNSPEVTGAFAKFGELISELLKFAALLVFGALVSISWIRHVGWRGMAFAFLAVILVRPVAMGIALINTELGVRERLAAVWFGPKGFASVVFGLLVLEAGVPNKEMLFHLIALCVTGSIIVQSSTDVPIANWLEGGMPGNGREIEGGQRE